LSFVFGVEAPGINSERSDGIVCTFLPKRCDAEPAQAIAGDKSVDAGEKTGILIPVNDRPSPRDRYAKIDQSSGI
jgi:hypothetical protein